MRYENYLYGDPKMREAFFAGWRQAATTFRSSSPNDYHELWSSLTDEHIMAQIITAQQSIEQQRLLDCESILNTMRVDDAKIRDFLFNVDSLNEHSVQTNASNEEVEDTMYRPKKELIQRPWCIRSYKNIPGPDDRLEIWENYRVMSGKTPYSQDPNVIAFLTANRQDKFKVTSNDDDFIKALIARDLAKYGNHDSALRYLVAILPGNALHHHAEYICNLLTNKAMFGIDSMMLLYALSGRAQRPEHIFLNYLLAIMRAVTKDHLMFYGHRMVTFIAHLAAATENTKNGEAIFSWMFPEDALLSFVSINNYPITEYLKAGSDSEKMSVEEVRKRVKQQLIRGAALRLAQLSESLIRNGETLNEQYVLDIRDFARLILFQTTDPKIGSRSEYDYDVLMAEMSNDEYRARITNKMFERYDTFVPSIPSQLKDG